MQRIKGRISAGVQIDYLVVDGVPYSPLPFKQKRMCEREGFCSQSRYHSAKKESTAKIDLLPLVIATLR